MSELLPERPKSDDESKQTDIKTKNSTEVSDSLCLQVIHHLEQMPLQMKSRFTLEF